MKKIISLLIVFSVLLVSVSAASEQDFNFALDTRSDLEKFTDELRLMVYGEEADSLLVEAEQHLSPSNGDEANVSDEKSENSDLTNRLVVKSKKEIESLNAVSHICGYNDLHVLQFENSDDFVEAYKFYSSAEDVEFVGEDVFCEVSENETTEITEPTTEESDTDLSDYNPTQVQADEFGFTALAEYLSLNPLSYDGTVEIAVVDTGVADDHELLAGRVEPTGFDSINGVSSYDDRGHGTHIAGVIVANTPDNVIIRPYKSLDSNGKGTVMQVYLGIMAAIEDGVDIINLSLSVRGLNDILYDAVSAAYNAGIVVVASAGNKGVDLQNVRYSPACFEEVITVSACSDDKRLTDFTNYGTVCDIAAPGVEITSAYLDNSYKTLSGTSMAAPFASAGVAYIIMRFNYETVDEISEELKRNAKPCLGNLGGRYLHAEYITREKQKSTDPIVSYTKTIFYDNMDLTISCEDKTAEIYYNTSLMPSDEYVLYSEPIALDYDMTLKTFSLAKNGLQSSVYTYSYTRAVSDEDCFTVDENGVLTGYSGNDIDIVVPNKIGSVLVKSVSAEAFKGNKNIRSVMFLLNMLSVGDDAFSGCDNLEYVRIKGATDIGERAFYGCSSLVNIATPQIQSIGDFAFYGCSSLKHFDFIRVKQIGESAFDGVSDLSGFDANSIVSIGNRAFYDTNITYLNLDVVEYIGDYAFAECENIEVVYLPRLKEIGNSTFSGCPKIIEIDADSVEKYGENCFGELTFIESFSMDSVSVVSDDMFNGCEFLEEISFAGVEKIGERAFLGTLITAADLPQVKTIGEEAFRGTLVTFANLPQVEIIGDSAFESLDTLESLNAPLVKEIGDCAFKECVNLNDVTLGDYEKIGAYCFYKTGVEDVSSKNAVFVGDYAFADCLNLKNALLPLVEDVGICAFSGCLLLEKLNLGFIKTFDYEQIKGSTENIIELSVNSAALTGFDGFDGLGCVFPKVKILKADSATTIFSELVKGNDVLHTVSFNSAAYVEDDAFSGCSALMSISLPNAYVLGERVFENCSALETVELDKAVSLGADCFKGCGKINTLVANGVTEFDFSTLKDSINIKSLGFNSLRQIKASTSFSKLFPKLRFFYADSLEKLPDNIFWNCTDLRQVSLNSLKEIQSQAFKDCNKITEISAEALKVIPTDFFSDNLSNVYIKANSAEVIEDNAFSYSDITGINAPNVKKIGEKAFEHTYSLKSVDFNNAETIGYMAFAYSSITEGYFNSVKTIGDEAFLSSSIESIRFPSAIEAGYRAFSGVEVETIELPNLVTAGEGCFSDMICADVVVRFRSLENIGIGAFENSVIKYSVFYVPSVVGDLPDGEGYKVLLGSTDIEFSSDLESASDIIARKGTSAERFANEKGLNYIEFCSENPILIVDEVFAVTTAYARTLTYAVLGFDMSYEWYTTDGENAEPVFVANGSTNRFHMDEIDYPYVFCVATSSGDGEDVVFQSKNFGFLVRLLAEHEKVEYRKDIGDCLVFYDDCISDVSSFVELDESFDVTCNFVNDAPFIGTESELVIVWEETFADGTVDSKYEYYYISICGDVNCDGVADVLDVSWYDKYFDYIESYPPCLAAVDFDKSETLDSYDYQSLVNYVLNK